MTCRGKESYREEDAIRTRIMELKSVEKIRRKIRNSSVLLGFEKKPSFYETLRFLQVAENVRVIERQSKPYALHYCSCNRKNPALELCR